MDKEFYQNLKDAAESLVISHDIENDAQEAWKLLETVFPEASNAFYQMLQKNDWMENVDREVKASLIDKQLCHWAMLFKADFSEDYVNSTLQLSIEHTKYNLSPSNYVFAYAFLMNILIRSIRDVYANNPRRALELTHAINSLMLIDMSLVFSLHSSDFVLLD